uniref:Ovule protein n=1 Tax=Steinernema glaseri TaxID=37863 RepID=A0A1I7YC18_9BILA
MDSDMNEDISDGAPEKLTGLSTSPVGGRLDPKYPFLVPRPPVASDEVFWDRIMKRMEFLGIKVNEKKKMARSNESNTVRKRPAQDHKKEKPRRRVTFDLDSE